MQDYDGVEPLTAQRLSADGSLGALAVHDEVAYDAVLPLPVALLTHLWWKLEQDGHAWTVIADCEVQQWPACLCLHVRGIDDRQAAGAQTLFDDTVQDRECGCGRGLVRFVVRDDGTAGVGRHDLGRLEVLLCKGRFA
jgi:hypothetical protein